MSIGKPLDGLTAIIIDEEKNILGSGHKGELCISGDQLTPGYWNNTNKNSTSFFFKNLNGVTIRFYKTGDSAFIDKDGDIMLLGRLDYQVKIQGYRIELGEIEFHVRNFISGQDAIAIDFVNIFGNQEIALFIEGKFSGEAQLIAYLKEKLPNYMIPTVIKSVERFELNTNGKVDRLNLKKLLSN
jgi:acyl-coenzyme A synthetase/AMP-(fatty) acid ligase